VTCERHKVKYWLDEGTGLGRFTKKKEKRRVEGKKGGWK